MSEQTGRQQGRQRSSQGSRGATRIEDGVVSKIAGMAARETEGIRMGSGTSQAAGSLLGSLTGGGNESQGVSVEVGEEEAAVDLTLTVEYGKAIPQLSESVRGNIVSRVESLTGLKVTEVNISVIDIFFPQEDQSRRELEGGQTG